MSKIRTYKELKRLRTFDERAEYLKLNGIVGQETFGFDRYINQQFYKSREWRRIRRDIIARDLGCDLGVEGYEIMGDIYIHHMNPITLDNLKNSDDVVFDPNYLICVSLATHNYIHYGTLIVPEPIIERRKGDTCLWKTTRS